MKRIMLLALLIGLGFAAQGHRHMEEMLATVPWQEIAGAGAVEVSALEAAPGAARRN